MKTLKYIFAAATLSCLGTVFTTDYYSIFYR